MRPHYSGRGDYPPNHHHASGNSSNNSNSGGGGASYNRPADFRSGHSLPAVIPARPPPYYSHPADVRWQASPTEAYARSARRSDPERPPSAAFTGQRATYERSGHRASYQPATASTSSHPLPPRPVSRPDPAFDLRIAPPQPMSTPISTSTSTPNSNSNYMPFPTRPEVPNTGVAPSSWPPPAHDRASSANPSRARTRPPSHTGPTTSNKRQRLDADPIRQQSAYSGGKGSYTRSDRKTRSPSVDSVGRIRRRDSSISDASSDEPQVPRRRRPSSPPRHSLSSTSRRRNQDRRSTSRSPSPPRSTYTRPTRHWSPPRDDRRHQPPTTHPPTTASAYQRADSTLLPKQHQPASASVSQRSAPTDIELSPGQELEEVPTPPASVSASVRNNNVPHIHFPLPPRPSDPLPASVPVASGAIGGAFDPHWEPQHSMPEQQQQQQQPVAPSTIAFKRISAKPPSQAHPDKTQMRKFFPAEDDDEHAHCKQDGDDAGVVPEQPIDPPTQSPTVTQQQPIPGLHAAPPPPPAAPIKPEEIYQRLAQVGEGTYGKVYKARNAETGILVALKRIRMEAEKDGFPITSVREIKLLQSLRHANVVSLSEMMVAKGGVYMVFEYLEHDLTGVLRCPEVHFSHANCKSIMQQLLQGLAYIHNRGVLHRDLKGSNILLSNKGAVKIADFGLARFYARKGRQNDHTNRVITQWYKPPELLYGATMYAAEVDMWSAGCIFLELFSRRPVFQGQDEINQLEVIYKLLGTPRLEDWPEVGELPWYELVKPRDAIPPRLRENFGNKKLLHTEGALAVANALLQLNPSKRPTAQEALNMPYFATEHPAPEQPVIEGIGEWHEWEAKLAKAAQQQRKPQTNRDR